VAVATLNGHITFFETKSSTQTGAIEGRKDLGSGRSDADLITAKKSVEGKCFLTLCYSADGACILAGGQSKQICIYHVKERLLVKKFELTQNRSFDAMDEVISRKKMTEFGNMALVEDRDDPLGSQAIRLPGTKRGDMSSRAHRPEVRVAGLQFSPTGRDFAAATTEGLLIYSLDSKLVFDVSLNKLIKLNSI
jgi:periodic tryptophan protein 2